MINRRTFLARLGAVLAAPPALEAQQAKSFKIGFLLTDQYGRQAFVTGLNELGYVEGKNLTLVGRYTEGRRDQLPNLAAEVVALAPDVIFVTTGYQVAAVAKVTKTIPIVAIAGDLVAEGLVAGLAKPGGNITGLQLLQPDAAAKRLALLKESVPGLARVGVLFGPVGQWFYDRVTQETRAAAQTLRLQVQIVQVRAAADLDSAFGALAEGRAEALMLTADAFTIANRERLAALAITHRWPTICDLRAFVDAGCLMSYGADVNALSQRAALYVDRILKGTKPSDLPIEQPTKFDLVMNSRTTKTLGITIPPSLLLRADRVIE